VAYLVINQVDGNIFTHRIQGEAIKVHPLLVFVAVFAGGEIAGLLGAAIAVRVLAVLHVLVAFFAARPRVRQLDRCVVVAGHEPGTRGSPRSADIPVPPDSSDRSTGLSFLYRIRLISSASAWRATQCGRKSCAVRTRTIQPDSILDIGLVGRYDVTVRLVARRVGTWRVSVPGTNHSRSRRSSRATRTRTRRSARLQPNPLRRPGRRCKAEE
jgi:hypothetical protein